MLKAGYISRIAGPFIVSKGMSGAHMNELVKVGEEGILGEIIQLEGETAAIQAYEETVGLKPGEEVIRIGKPLSVELGPGLVSQIFDGIQRPLIQLQQLFGPNIERGTFLPALDKERKWDFNPKIKKNEKITGGDILGVVTETSLIEHKVLVPPGVSGVLEDIVDEGAYSVTDAIAKVRARNEYIDLYMMHEWPVRNARPYRTSLAPTVPLITGQRIIDLFFPIAKGGVAALAGGFGTGKTVLVQTLMQWIDADIVILAGCGERGNEMVDLLERFPKLLDYKSGKPLIERTIIVANTSNMPIAAREASIYTTITIAEYYRDMGYSVLMLADSTSRWAEALREISGRLEEMPGEEGFPAYLASRLAGFYSRAGMVKCLGHNGEGSVSVIGVVSPPGGDFSEPVTRNTLRLTKIFWALDAALAHRRHYPAINWSISYSEYIRVIEKWFIDSSPDWPELRNKAVSLLQEEEKLREVVSLVGTEILGDEQRSIFEMAKMLKEYFLLQSASNPIDMFCPVTKTRDMLHLIIRFYDKAKLAMSQGIQLSQILSLEVVNDITRMKNVPSTVFDDACSRIDKKITEQFDQLMEKEEYVA